MWSSGFFSWLCKRSCLFLLGAVAAMWSLTLLPSFTGATLPRELVARMLMNERFKLSTLLELSNQLELQGRPVISRAELFRAKSMVAMRSAQQANGVLEPESADRLAAAADEKLRASLFMNPADSFTWALLYTLDLRSNGFSRTTIPYLEESYTRGPFEGWIALSRNRSSLGIFQMLSNSLQNTVVAEFAALVAYGFFDDAAQILTGVGWQHRDRLLSGLSQTDLVARQRFGRSLSSIGARATIPGLEGEERPWR